MARRTRRRRAWHARRASIFLSVLSKRTGLVTFNWSGQARNSARHRATRMHPSCRSPKCDGRGIIIAQVDGATRSKGECSHCRAILNSTLRIRMDQVVLVDARRLELVRARQQPTKTDNHLNPPVRQDCRIHLAVCFQGGMRRGSACLQRQSTMHYAAGSEPHTLTPLLLYMHVHADAHERQHSARNALTRKTERDDGTL